LTTVVYEGFGAPKVTLSKEGAQFSATIEVAGLAPYRSTTAEERGVGISSLSPPTVATKSITELVSSSSLAVQASMFATPGLSPGPGDLSMVHFRVSRAVRAALRKLGEEI
jgi:hypothetical protein